MPLRQAIQALRRLAGAPFRGSKVTGQGPEEADLPRVNALAGTEPIKPELSGLRIRYPSGMPPQLRKLRIQLSYRWQPSDDYRRREVEMRKMNAALKHRLDASGPPPPVLSYPEQLDPTSPQKMEPTRIVQPPWRRRRKEPPRDLSDLDAVQRLRPTWLIEPRPTDDDLGAYLSVPRTLISPQYRRRLRSSPYPWAAAVALLLCLGGLGTVWMRGLHQAEAVALGRYHNARHAFQTQLDVALVYGVDPRVLQPLETRARALEARSAPAGLSVIARSRVRFYSKQERDYRSLLRRLRRLERRARWYWTWREGQTYASLVRAAKEAQALGLQQTVSRVPNCGTPKCYRAVVYRQEARAGWLRQTANTLRVYGAAMAAAPDPATAAGIYAQEARSLIALLPFRATVPARIPVLDGMYATATTAREYARVGALAHLDVDALRAELVRALPARALVVSTEEETLTCYARGRAVRRSLVATDSSTPTGIFHIQARQASVPAVYWDSFGGYRDGTLLDWMPFSRSAAFQAAPWRRVFGPNSDAAPPLFAPSTPGSVDLPPAAAAFLFRWAPVGTEVVVY